MKLSNRTTNCVTSVNFTYLKLPLLWKANPLLHQCSLAYKCMPSVELLIQAYLPLCLLLIKIEGEQHLPHCIHLFSWYNIWISWWNFLSFPTWNLFYLNHKDTETFPAHPYQRKAAEQYFDKPGLYTDLCYVWDNRCMI